MTAEISPVRPKLGVVVVNYGSHDLVATNIGSLEFGEIPHAVVVVDNFTSAGEVQRIDEVCRFRNWTLVRNERNLGFGAAVNAGVARAQSVGCSVFLVINPDATLSEESLVGLYERSVAQPMVLVGPRIVRPDGSKWFEGGVVVVSEGRTTTRTGSNSSDRHGWLSGACLMISDELWTSSGGFDDSYFLYWEDVDLSWRCVEAGGELAVASDLTAVHSVGGTQRFAGKSPRYVYYNCRNRLIFAAQHLTRRQTLVWIAGSARYGREVLLRGGRRALLKRPLPLLGAAIGGTVVGVVKALALSRTGRKV